MQKINEEIELQAFFLSEPEPGLHFIKTKPIVITVEHYEELYTEQLCRSGNKKIFVLVDTGSVKMFTRKAVIYAEKASNQSYCALGLVVQTHVASMVVNFLLSIMKTQYPIKTFSDFEEAKNWLKKIKNMQ